MIYPGGWAHFCQESAVTKKEPMEDFSWMSEQKSTFNGLTWTINSQADFEDCREALNRAEGTREYLKNYVALEEDEGINFRDPIGEQIKLRSHHSGGSYFAMLWTYRFLLNNWDGWVLAQKEWYAFNEYEKIQVHPHIITSLYYSCRDVLDGKGPGLDEFLARAAVHGLAGGIEDIYPILLHLFTEHKERQALNAENEKKRNHNTLIGGLKWKYKHPIRWFDTLWGSSISPTTPQDITEEAFVEMEAKYPGYRAHIQRVKDAMVDYRGVYPMCYTTGMELFLKKWELA
jgi:hypothetical protein